MKAKKYWIFAVLLVVCVSVMTEQLQSLDIEPITPDELDSLKGLEGVEVIVSITPPKEEYKKMREQLNKEIESQLCQKGIKVFSSYKEQFGNPWLYVDIHISTNEEYGITTFYIAAKLLQDVLLERDTTIRNHAETWGVSTLKSGNTSSINRQINGVAKEFVDYFAKDYFEANPKEQTKDEPNNK